MVNIKTILQNCPGMLNNLCHSIEIPATPILKIHTYIQFVLFVLFLFLLEVFTFLWQKKDLSVNSTNNIKFHRVKFEGNSSEQMATMFYLLIIIIIIID